MNTKAEEAPSQQDRQFNGSCLFRGDLKLDLKLEILKIGSSGEIGHYNNVVPLCSHLITGSQES